MIIKYLKDKITFTCIYCHYYVVPEYSAYMIMYKGGGGGGGVILKISWLAYNIVHGMVSKQNVYVYIYIYIYIYNVKKIKQKTESFSRRSRAHLIEQTYQFWWF